MERESKIVVDIRVPSFGVDITRHGASRPCCVTKFKTPHFDERRVKVDLPRLTEHEYSN